MDPEEMLRALDESFGTWDAREEDGAGCVERLRRGLAWQLARLMVVLLDTSVLIDHLRGDERARRALRDVAQAGTRVTASVMSGWRSWPACARPRRSRRAGFSTSWTGSPWMRSKRASWPTGTCGPIPGVDPVDYVIAATAERLDANLWTRTVKHFPMFPELQAPY